MDKKVPSFLCKRENFISKKSKILLFNFSCAILNLLGRFTSLLLLFGGMISLARYRAYS